MATVRRSSRIKRRPLADLTNYEKDDESLHDLISDKSGSSIGSSFFPDESERRADLCLIREEIVESRDRRKTKRNAPLKESVKISASIKQISNNKQHEETIEIQPYVKTPKLNGKKNPSPKISDDYFVLDQEFIEKQRQYFVEIDAYKLDEEIISDSDLE